MKFLDLNGLTHFFGKVKTWAGNNYLSLKGGTINGDVNISRNVSALQFKKTNGTSTQVLIADGSVKGIGSANGVAGLDSNGYVPLSQLGNLDTTVAEVVTVLPTTNIKKHIYLVKDTDGVTQNQYEEYLYTGDTSAAYDASKWEKLGDFRATVDLADYAKKSNVISRIYNKKEAVSGIRNQYLVLENGNNSQISTVSMDEAAIDMSGLLSWRDKKKLNGIEENANNYSLPFATEQTLGGIKLGYHSTQIGSRCMYPLETNSDAKAYVTIPMAEPVQHGEGLMRGEDKSKLDGISSGATADSAITTEEIDALFA